MRQRNTKLRNDCSLASSAHLHSARVIVTRLRCFQNFLELIWREKWRVNRSRYCIIGEITRLFCLFFSFFSKYLVLYFTHHFEKYVFYRNFEKYNAYVLLILVLHTTTKNWLQSSVLRISSRTQFHHLLNPRWMKIEKRTTYVPHLNRNHLFH